MPTNPPNGQLLQSQISKETIQPKRTSEDPSPNKKMKLNDMGNVENSGLGPTDENTIPNAAIFKSLESIGNEFLKIGQENSELKAKIEALENDLKQQEHTKQRILAVQKENATLKQDFAKLKSELKEKTEALENEVKKRKHTEQRVGSLQKENATLKQDFSKLKSELKEKTEQRISGLQKENETLKQDLSKLKSKNEGIENELKQHEHTKQKVDSLQKENAQWLDLV